MTASFPLLLEILTMSRRSANRVEAMYGLGLPLAIQKNESVDSDPLVDGIENEMTPNTWYCTF